METNSLSSCMRHACCFLNPKQFLERCWIGAVQFFELKWFLRSIPVELRSFSHDVVSRTLSRNVVICFWLYSFTFTMTVPAMVTRWPVLDWSCRYRLTLWLQLLWFWRGGMLRPLLFFDFAECARILILCKHRLIWKWNLICFLN